MWDTDDHDQANPAMHAAVSTISDRPATVETAIELFQKVIELDPTFGAMHASLGRIYATQGRYELAWKHAHEADRLGDPSVIEQLKRISPPGES